MANDMNALFAALSDPTRRELTERLGEGPASVKDLAAPYDMALPSFLRHVSVLEEAGLVISAKHGRSRMVALRPHALDGLEDWLEARRAQWTGRFARLEAAARRMELEADPGPAKPDA